MREIMRGNYEENYHRKLGGEIITGNQENKLSQEIISQYISSREKCGNYRDTAVSKN